MEGGGWRVEDGGWKMEGGGWRVEDGGWRVEGGGWRVEDGGWRINMPWYLYLQNNRCVYAIPTNGHSEKHTVHIYDEVGHVGDEPLHWHGLIQDTVGSWGLEEECTLLLPSPPAAKQALVPAMLQRPFFSGESGV